MKRYLVFWNYETQSISPDDDAAVETRYCHTVVETMSNPEDDDVDDFLDLIALLVADGNPYVRQSDVKITGITPIRSGR